MKRILPTALILLAVGCSESPITEVGNPTTATAPAKATVAAVETGLEDVFAALTDPGREGSFSCAFDESRRTVRCDCAGGGTFTQTFSEPLGSDDSPRTFAQDFDQLYEDCVVSACGEDVLLTGRISGHVSGETNPSARTFSARGEFRTESACSGLTANEVSIGLTFASTADGSVRTTRGTLCVDDQSFTFESLEDLEDQIDFEDACHD